MVLDWETTPSPQFKFPSYKEGCTSGRNGIEALPLLRPQLPSSKEGCPSGRGGIEVITHCQVEPHREWPVFFMVHFAGGFMLVNHPTPSLKEGSRSSDHPPTTHHPPPTTLSQLPSSKEGCPSGRGGIAVTTHRQVEPYKGEEQAVFLMFWKKKKMFSQWLLSERGITPADRMVWANKHLKAN